MRRKRLNAEAAEFAEKTRLCVLCVLCVLLSGTRAVAQSSAPTRLAILQAEDRRAPTAGDLATIRAGVRSGDPQTVRIAVRR
jgi:hypothetical protein